MKLKDWIILSVITIIYSVMAFINLGDFNAPQTSARMAFGDMTVLTFEVPQKITKISLYSGVNRRVRRLEGDAMLYVEKSDDGVEWTKFNTLKDGYIDYKGEASVIYFGDTSGFAWREYKLNETAKYIRLRMVSMDVMLYEFAVFGEDGTQLEFVGREEIKDESGLIPNAPSHMNSAYYNEISSLHPIYEKLNGIPNAASKGLPLGERIISLGILLFGMTPFGWRFMGVLAGILMLPVIYLIGKKISGGGTWIPTFATSLLALDFMHFSFTRMAGVDSFAVLFTMIAYYFMFDFYKGKKKKIRELVLSGIFISLACAIKWSFVFAIAGLIVMWLVGVIWGERKDFLKILLVSIFSFVCMPIIAYYGLYRPSSVPAISNLAVNASAWFEWIYMRMPVRAGQNIVLMGNPLIWWGGALSLPFVLVFGRKSRAGIFIIIGYLAGLLMGIFASDAMFIYNYFICSIFLILSLAFVLGKLPKKGIWFGTAMVGALALFILFYPVISGNGAAVKYIEGLQWLKDWKFF